MGKYFHKFQTEEDFINSYYSSGNTLVTAITVNNVVYTFWGMYEQAGYFVWVNEEGATKKWCDTDKVRNPEVGGSVFPAPDGDTYTPGSNIAEIQAIATTTIDLFYTEPWVSAIVGKGAQFNHKIQNNFDPGGGGYVDPPVVDPPVSDIVC